MEPKQTEYVLIDGDLKRLVAQATDQFWADDWAALVRTAEHIITAASTLVEMDKQREE